MCGSRVYILRVLWILSSVPRLEYETLLPAELAARLPHVIRKCAYVALQQRVSSDHMAPESSRAFAAALFHSAEL